MLARRGCAWLGRVEAKVGVRQIVQKSAKMWILGKLGGHTVSCGGRIFFLVPGRGQRPLQIGGLMVVRTELALVLRLRPPPEHPAG